MEKTKNFIGPIHHGKTRPKTVDKASCAVMANVGVLRIGWTLPNAAGRTPQRPMRYHMRVATFWPARHTPQADVIIARSASHHSGPQTRCAINSAGNSCEETSLRKSSVPQPITCPHMTVTSMMPMIAMDAIMAVSYTHLRAHET